jgi:hypothetical protein
MRSLDHGVYGISRTKLWRTCHHFKSSCRSWKSQLDGKVFFFGVPFFFSFLFLRGVHLDFEKKTQVHRTYTISIFWMKIKPHVYIRTYTHKRRTTRYPISVKKNKHAIYIVRTYLKYAISSSSSSLLLLLLLLGKVWGVGLCMHLKK